jgi:hypothetical protein
VGRVQPLGVLSHVVGLTWMPVRARPRGPNGGRRAPGGV